MHKLRFTSCERILLHMLLVVACGASSVTFAQTKTTTAATAATPSDAVRAFYKALGEKRFRDALMMSAFRPAVENLSPSEFEELRPDFERMAEGADKIQITGEQISGDRASVFVKLTGDATSDPPLEVQLRRVSGSWFVTFNDEVEKSVKRDGNKYFFKLRIETHEQEVESMLVRIASAQLVYAQQHAGQYADLPTLVKEKLLPEDVLTPDSTGYRYHLTLSADRKSYTAGAEPAIYGRSGMRSFYMDATGMKSSDTGGKPYEPKK